MNPNYSRGLSNTNYTNSKSNDEINEKNLNFLNEEVSNYLDDEDISDDDDNLSGTENQHVSLGNVRTTTTNSKQDYAFNKTMFIQPSSGGAINSGKSEKTDNFLKFKLEEFGKELNEKSSKLTMQTETLKKKDAMIKTLKNNNKLLVDKNAKFEKLKSEMTFLSKKVMDCENENGFLKQENA